MNAHRRGKAYLQRTMLELTHYSYLACYAIDRMCVEYPESVSAAVPICTEKLCRDRDSLHGGTKAISLNSETIRRRLGGMQTWIIQSLLIRLDALLHGTLDILGGRSPEADSNPIEPDINRLLTKSKLHKLQWAYKDVVLLAVYRNCVVHGDGSLPAGRQQRLIAAGWTGAAWEERIHWSKPSFDDFLRLKKAVRSIASACVQANVTEAPTDQS